MTALVGVSEEFRDNSAIITLLITNSSVNSQINCKVPVTLQLIMIEGIIKKFVRQESLPSLPALNQLFKKGLQFKVLNITNCPTVESAIELLLNKSFREAFVNDNNCFVLVFEVNDRIDDFDMAEELFESSKPLIISFESKMQHEKFAVYKKEANERSLVKILHRDFRQSDWMEDGFNVSFNVEILLQALAVGNGGTLNTKILEATINHHECFGEMRFIERAAFNNNVLSLKFLRLFDNDLSLVNADNMKLFEIAAKSCDFQGFSALLDLPFDYDATVFNQTILSIEILQPQNTKNFNLLMIASESGNTEAVNFLLKCSYDINQTRDVDETAAAVAWQKENYEIFVMLLKENSLFPINFLSNLKQQKERGKVKNVLMFINDLNSLHENIKRGRMNEVRDFLERNPTIRHAYNIRNESAAATALRSEQFAIYEYLTSQGVCLGFHEDIGEILQNQQKVNCHDDRRTMMKKILLHQMHKKYFKPTCEKHLMTLLAHSHVGFDSPSIEHRSYFKFIKEAFECLDKIEEISAILNIVSKSNFFRIVFDFNRNAVNFLDPLTCKRTKGTSYFKSGYIYVGAKGLISDHGRLEVIGTLAHELAHYAIQLVYENSCKPYRDHDRKLQREFESIMTYCEFYKEEEDKILNVFSYPQDHQQAEMIVRVPHLLAFYMNDYDKLQTCQRKYENLFSFFKNQTLIDIRNEQPLMIAKRETVELNDWLGVIRPLLNLSITLKPEHLKMDLNTIGRICIIVSNCVKLTVKAIHLQLQRDLKARVESFFIFAKLDAVIEDEKAKTVLAKALVFGTKPTIIFECSSETMLEDLITIVDALKTDERVVFVVRDEGDNRYQQESFHLFSIQHAWEDFPSESQDELWTFNVNFQGKTLTLRELMKIPSKAVDAIPFCQLLGRCLNISEPLEFHEIDFFIERKFLSQNEEFCFESISEHARIHRVVLISDDPGAGKTTAFKSIATKLKDKFPDFWVAYVDLKQFIDIFEQHKLECFCKADALASFLAEKILKLERFELELFRQLFADNRVIILMDGIDEICPNYKYYIVKLLISLKTMSRNQLWISTRPHLANELSQELDCDLFHLKPFKSIEQRNFYYQFYEHRKVPRADLDRYVKGIEKLMSFLNQNRLFWSTITNEIISNPLFMRIAAEIYDDDVMQQSKNGKCLTLCNLYLMYERFIEKKFSLWMHKGRLSITDQIEIHRSSKSVMRCHLRLALERTFNDSKVKSLVEESHLTIEQITRVGLMSHDGLELQFFHRTFAEFFVADFLFRKVFCSDSYPEQSQRPSKERRIIMRLFVRVLTSEQFQMIRAFLGNAIELVKHNKEPRNFARLARLFCRESRRSEREQILMVAVNDGCINLTTLVLEISIATECILLKLMNREKRYLENVLVNSLKIHGNNVETVKSLWGAATKVYSQTDVKTLLLKVSQFGENLVHITAKSDSPQLIEFLLTEVKNAASEDEFKDFLLLRDDTGKTSMEIAIEFNKNPLSLLSIWKFFEEIFTETEQTEFLRKLITFQSNILHLASANSEKMLQEFWKIVCSKISENELKKNFISVEGFDEETFLLG